MPCLWPRTWDDDLTGKPAFLRGSDHHAAPRFEACGSCGGSPRTTTRSALTSTDSSDRLLSALDDTGTARDTIVCFISDHGESLGEHGLYAKSVMYEQSVRVPWILRWPGRIIAGARLRRPVGGVDLVPTLLELAGDTGTDRVSRPLARHGAAVGNRAARQSRCFPRFARWSANRMKPRSGWPGTVMVRDGRWKYIRHRFDPCEELYDLHADPDEMSNLIETHPSRAADLHAMIAAVLRAHGAGPYAWAGDR